MSERFRIRDSSDRVEDLSEGFKKYMERREKERFAKEVLESVREKLDAQESEIRTENLSRIKIESPSETVAYLVGALRDGSVFYDKASRNYFTMYYQKYREWLEDSIGPRLKKEFNRPFRIEEYTPGHYRLKLSSKEMYTMWKERFSFPEDGKGQGSWTVPEEIKESNTHVKACYIRGVFDTEGDVSPVSSKTPYVGISQKNEPFLQELTDMLSEMDIHAGKIHIIDEKSGTQRFAISERTSLERFITIIGSEHPVKSKDLYRIRSLLNQEFSLGLRKLVGLFTG
jgi:intein-encoded DNA endonuclease-like protein